MYQKKLRNAKIILSASAIFFVMVAIISTQFQNEQKTMSREANLLAPQIAELAEQSANSDEMAQPTEVLEGENIVSNEDIQQVKNELDEAYNSPAPQEYQMSAEQEMIEETPQAEETPKLNAEDFYNRAVLDFDRKRYNSAMEEFNKALNLTQDETMKANCKKYIIRCYEGKGRPSEAFAAAERFYAQSGTKEDLTALIHLAAQAGKTNTAKAHVLNYVKHHPEAEEEFSAYLK